MAIQDGSRYESQRQLLGQCSNGKAIQKLKTEWVPDLGQRSLAEAKMDIGSYFMGDYNQMRPHQLHGGISPQAAEEKLKTVSGIS